MLDSVQDQLFQNNREIYIPVVDSLLISLVFSGINACLSYDDKQMYRSWTLRNGNKLTSTTKDLFSIISSRLWGKSCYCLSWIAPRMIQITSFATLLAFTILAEATPARRDLSSSQCTSASLLCCNAVQTAGDPAVGTILTLFGRADVDPSVKCGIQCTPMSILGPDGGIWWVQTYCLTDLNSRRIVDL